MISYEWRRELGAEEAGEVDVLVKEAADYDEEAGFTGFSGMQAVRQGDDAWQLIVRVRPSALDPERADTDERDATTWPLAAYLHLQVSPPDGLGTVRLVVKPEFRSLGVATMLFEMLGSVPSPTNEWSSTGTRALQAWAHGDHPAAQRMAGRFRAAQTREMWKVVKRLGDGDLPDAAEAGQLSVRVADRDEGSRFADGSVQHDHVSLSVWVSPALREHLLPRSTTLVAENGSGLVGLAKMDDGIENGSPRKAVGSVLTLSVAGGTGAEATAEALLRSGLDWLQQRGVPTAQAYIDATVDPIVSIVRKLGFEHDRSDVCFRSEAEGKSG